MTVSDTNRKRFEGIGLDHIRRELTVGNSYYIKTTEARGEAEEWVAEQEEKIREAEADRIKREKIIMYAAIVAGIAGVAAIVLPILLPVFHWQ